MPLYDLVAGTKQCGKCGERKAVSEFNKQSKHGTDPYANRCRECASAGYKEWALKNKALKSAYLATWYRSNIQSVKEYDAARWLNGGKERQRKRVAQNKDRYASYGHSHRARKAGNGGSYTAEDVTRIKRQQRGKCAVCRKRLTEFEIDHIEPLSRGGSNHPSNIQLLCPFCNRSKGATEPIVFMQRMGRLL